MKIYLIGMPGSGKSTLGKQLADQLSLHFVDLDKEIEDHEQSDVKGIFREKGEDHFRLVESKLLREWAGTEQSFVMATGGGAPCFHQGIDIINKTGLSVFLDVSVDVLLKRLHANTDRPLLNTTDVKEKDEKLRVLRTARLSCYQQAQIMVVNPTYKKLEEAIRFKK